MPPVCPQAALAIKNKANKLFFNEANLSFFNRFRADYIGYSSKVDNKVDKN
jgi:hypothetical protein